MSLPEFAEALGDGVCGIDTGFHRPRFDAAYLMVDAGRAAFIDTGTNFARAAAAGHAAGRWVCRAMRSTGSSPRMCTSTMPAAPGC